MSARRALATAAALVVMAAAAPAAGGPGGGMDLTQLADLDVVEVRVDAARFAAERVVAMRITNRKPYVVRGFIGACQTVFTPADPGHSAIRPAESGPFAVAGQATVTIVRPFRLIDPAKRPPGTVAYRLDDAAEAEPGCRN